MVDHRDVNLPGGDQGIQDLLKGQHTPALDTIQLVYRRDACLPVHNDPMVKVVELEGDPTSINDTCQITGVQSIDPVAASEGKEHFRHQQRVSLGRVDEQGFTVLRQVEVKVRIRHKEPRKFRLTNGPNTLQST